MAMGEAMVRGPVMNSLPQYPTESCKTAEFPELTGVTIFEAKCWKGAGVTCDCCDTENVQTYRLIQLIRWGTEWIRTARFNYNVCETCRADHERLLQLFNSEKVKGIIDVVPQTIVFGERANDF